MNRRVTLAVVSSVGGGREDGKGGKRLLRGGESICGMDLSCGSSLEQNEGGEQGE